MHRLNEHYTESKGLHLNYSIITDMIEAGKNVIEMKFRLPGYKKGILFSICGILLYSVSLIFFNRLNLYRRSEKE